MKQLVSNFMALLMCGNAAAQVESTVKGQTERSEHAKPSSVETSSEQRRAALRAALKLQRSQTLNSDADTPRQRKLSSGDLAELRDELRKVRQGGTTGDRLD